METKKGPLAKIPKVNGVGGPAPHNSARLELGGGEIKPIELEGGDLVNLTSDRLEGRVKRGNSFKPKSDVGLTLGIAPCAAGAIPNDGARAHMPPSLGSWGAATHSINITAQCGSGAPERPIQALQGKDFPDAPVLSEQCPSLSVAPRFSKSPSVTPRRDDNVPENHLVTHTNAHTTAQTHKHTLLAMKGLIDSTDKCVTEKIHLAMSGLGGGGKCNEDWVGVVADPHVELDIDC